MIIDIFGFTSTSSFVFCLLFFSSVSSLFMSSVGLNKIFNNTPAFPPLPENLKIAFLLFSWLPLHF